MVDKTLKRKFLLIIVSLVVTLIIIELLLRLLLPNPQLVTIEGESANQPLQTTFMTINALPNNGLYIETKNGLRLKRNTSALIKNHRLSQQDISIRTNSLGYRGEELGPKQSDEYRILILGDSITFGDYVKEEETYPFLLEEILKKDPTLQNKKITVINAGIGTADLNTEVSILLETGLSTDPDLVVVGMYLNDALASPSIKIQSLPQFLSFSYILYYLNEYTQVILAKSQFYDLDEGLNLDKEKKVFLDRNEIVKTSWQESDKGFNYLVSYNFHDWGMAWSESYWQKIDEMVKVLKEVESKNGFKLSIILFPVSYQVESKVANTFPQERFSQIMAKNQVPYLDLLPVLKEEYTKEETSLFYDWCHYKPVGNQIVAEGMAKFLLSQDYLF